VVTDSRVFVSKRAVSYARSIAVNYYVMIALSSTIFPKILSAIFMLVFEILLTAQRKK
jgi:hypothetical protein